MGSPIPVEEFLKSSNGQPAKLLLLVSSTPDENNVSEWMADEFAEIVKKKDQVEVARYALPKLRISPCVGCYAGGGRTCMDPCDRNSIESDIYAPNDQMMVLYDQMREADMMVIATDIRWGGLNHVTQRFLERLNPFVNMAAVGKPMLKKKVGGVLTAGVGAEGLAANLLLALNSVGFALPKTAFTSWHVPRTATPDLAKSAYEKSKQVHDSLELMATSLVDYSKLLRGE